MSIWNVSYRVCLQMKVLERYNRTIKYLTPLKSRSRSNSGSKVNPVSRVILCGHLCPIDTFHRLKLSTFFVLSSLCTCFVKHCCIYIVLVQCTDGWLYNETFHSCYKIFKSENVTYDEAFRNCENQGAKLTNLQNPTELEFMRGMLRSRVFFTKCLI